MTIYTEKILDIETGKEIIRDYTNAEIALVQESIAISETLAAEAKIKANEKAALLNKLGITEDEAKLLLS